MEQNEQIKILLVDDDDIDIMSFERALKKTGLPYELTTCTYANEALDIFKSKRDYFNCLFIDYQLPGVDGLQLLRQMIDLGADIPISVMTSHGDEKLAVEMMKAGAFDYFPKSVISPEKLNKSIHSIIQFNKIHAEKKEMAFSLKKHKEFLQGMTDSSPNIIYILDIQQSKFIYYNRDILVELGYVGEENKKLVYPSFVSLMHPNDQKKLHEHIETIKDGQDGEIYEFEFRIKNKDEEWVWYFNRDTIYKRTKDGKVKDIIGTSTNISNLKKVEQEYQKAKEVAERALEIKAEFLSNMSHEIRTPMNAIIGLTDIVLQESLEPQVKDNLKSIKQSADNLLVIINDILDFSKIEAGKVKIENTSFNFQYQLQHIKKTMAFKAEQKSLNFDVMVDERIPVYLKGDPFRLNQVLLNLCSNAIKFTQEGSVNIFVKLLSEQNDKVKINFSVEDTGIGISEEQQNSIFESFTQADVQITRQFGGTGLGLTITKQLISLMGGQIHLQSTMGKGSRFYFNLEFDISNETTETPINYTLVEKSLEGLNILVMEDNIINQKVIRQILSKWDCSISIADNGLLGIEKMKKEEFDLLLMDLQMPVMDGFTATKAIRSGEAGLSYLRIPIIALTADAFPETREKVLEWGMNDLVSKPFRKAILNDRIFQTAKNYCPEKLVRCGNIQS